ncbi:hypothetical protein VNO77_03424 [Canavalia gladiata]|uniref:Uncharacterized protein n=1 Tax=Canavalia gladiata TaxID=3824 RepID=A0AAN9R3V9_CANGL
MSFLDNLIVGVKGIKNQDKLDRLYLLASSSILEFSSSRSIRGCLLTYNIVWPNRECEWPVFCINLAALPDEVKQIIKETFPLITDCIAEDPIDSTWVMSSPTYLMVFHMGPDL